MTFVVVPVVFVVAVPRGELSVVKVSGVLRPTAVRCRQREGDLRR